MRIWMLNRGLKSFCMSRIKKRNENESKDLKINNHYYEIMALALGNTERNLKSIVGSYATLYHQELKLGSLESLKPDKLVVVLQALAYVDERKPARFLRDTIPILESWMKAGETLDKIVEQLGVDKPNIGAVLGITTDPNLPQELNEGLEYMLKATQSAIETQTDVAYKETAAFSQTKAKAASLHGKYRAQFEAAKTLYQKTEEIRQPQVPGNLSQTPPDAQSQGYSDLAAKNVGETPLISPDLNSSLQIVSEVADFHIGALLKNQTLSPELTRAFGALVYLLDNVSGREKRKVLRRIEQYADRLGEIHANLPFGSNARVGLITYLSILETHTQPFYANRATK